MLCSCVVKQGSVSRNIKVRSDEVKTSSYVFKIMMLRSAVDRYQHFGGTCCFLLQSINNDDNLISHMECIINSEVFLSDGD